jgi:class 3 adenylate cyclase/tetratricopeptide (TPR) repeat protein
VECPYCGTASDRSTPQCGACGSVFGGSTVDRDSMAPRPYTPAHLSAGPLSFPGASDGERKPVTVLFCDIAQSIRTAEQLGAERMHGLLACFFETALAEVHRFGGTINQFLGDGFMALFGAPVGHEDHARRGVLASLALREAVARSPALVAANIRIRIGLNSGAVIVGPIGDKLRTDYTAVGDTTNVAARLEELAEPSSIVVSESVQRATVGQFEYHPLGDHQLRGREQAVKVFEVLRARAGSAAMSAGRDAGLVGRSAEWQLIEAELHGLLRGQGGIVVICGEAGIGKSRLLQQARAAGVQAGLRTLAGEAISYGRTLSYWPFREVFRQAFGVGALDGDQEAMAKLSMALNRLFREDSDEIEPYLASLLALPLPAELAARTAMLDGLAMGHQIFRACMLTLERIALEQPTVVLFEDWHWSDASSRSLLEHLLPLVTRCPLLFVLATRPDRDGIVDRLARDAAGAGSHVEHRTTIVDLQPLASLDARILTQSLLDEATVPEVIHQLLESKARGNPFYVGELARTLKATGAIESRRGTWEVRAPLDELPLPTTVEGVILARLDRLGDRVKQVAKAASVVGRTFERRLLQGVVGGEDDLHASLRSLQDAGLVHRLESAPSEETFGFGHPLIQQATYDSLLDEQRRRLHAQVGAVIEQTHAERLEFFFSTLAYHYGRAGNDEKWRSYLLLAADHADRLSADEEALELYAAVLAEGSKAQRLGPQERAVIESKIGDAHFRAGRNKAAEANYETALALLDHAAPKSRTRLAFEVICWYLFLAASVYLPRRERRLPLGDRAAVAVKVYESVGWIHYFSDPLRNLYDSIRILRIGRRDTRSRAFVVGLIYKANIWSTIGLYSLAKRLHDWSAQAAQALGEGMALGLAHQMYSHHAFVTGQWRAAEQFAKRGAEHLWDSGNARMFTGTLTWRAIYLSALGEPKRFEIATDYFRTIEEFADRQSRCWATNVRAMLRYERGEYQEAVKGLEWALATYRELPDARLLVHGLGIRCNCLFELGDEAAASEAAAEAMRVIDRHHLTGTLKTVAVVANAELLLSRVCVWGSASPAARKAAREAVSLARKQGRRVLDDGAVDALRLDADLHWVRGRLNAARELWEEGIRLAERLGAEPAKARLLRDRSSFTGDAADAATASALFRATGCAAGRGPAPSPREAHAIGQIR